MNHIRVAPTTELFIYFYCMCVSVCVRACVRALGARDIDKQCRYKASFALDGKTSYTAERAVLVYICVLTCNGFLGSKDFDEICWINNLVLFKLIKVSHLHVNPFSREK